MTHEITSGTLIARISPRGAELCSLRGPSGLEYIWQAQEPWTRHGPTLFPIIGRLVDDRYRVGGREYKLGIHGFAPNKTFRWAERGAACCRLELADDEETRAVYPFRFALSVGYAVDANTLVASYTLANTGGETLPASLGTHPGFNWPLLPGASKDGHRIVFSNDPGTPVFRGVDGLMQPEPSDDRLTDRTLPLADAIFDAGALVFDSPRSLRYETPTGHAVEVTPVGFPKLGIWMRPPGGFICFECWHGHASPANFTGAFVDKPGLMHLRPGETRSFSVTIRLQEPGLG